jgi:NADH:ubiquinone oxidoreductase subunit K
MITENQKRNGMLVLIGTELLIAGSLIAFMSNQNIMAEERAIVTSIVILCFTLSILETVILYNYFRNVSITQTV